MNKNIHVFVHTMASFNINVHSVKVEATKTKYWKTPELGREISD